jgi:DNA-binding NarL/FixJ family response regulator
LLERGGFQVIGEAADGLEAVKQVASLRPEVVIMDISMPNLNGIDAAREISTSVPTTKVVLLTQHEEDVYVARALEAGVRGYVLKS